MTLRTVSVFVVSVCLVLSSAKTSFGENALYFKIVQSCVSDPEDTKIDTHYFYVGCNVTMACSYFHCLDGINSDLNISHSHGDVQPEVLEKTACVMKVKLSNMIEDHSGTYTCKNTLNQSHTQKQLDFKMLKVNMQIAQRCPSDANETSLHRTLTEYTKVNCTVKIFCGYEQENYCKHRRLSSSSLNASIPTEDNATLLRNHTTCSLGVVIPAVTLHHQGNYMCNFGNELTYTLRLHVGYAPVKPENLTLVFRPRESLQLLLDKVKTGTDLNDKNTVWNVTYLWRHIHTCQEPDQGSGKEDNMYVACKLDLQKNYHSWGHYGGSTLGSINIPIFFKVIVRNRFGSTEPVRHDFYIPHFVKPRTFRNVSVADRGPTWIQLQIQLPQNLDKYTCQEMINDTLGALQIKYTLSNVPEEKHHQLRSETQRFTETYGFFRNLHDDEQASSLTPFSQHVVVEQIDKWDSKCRAYTNINITGLYPFTFYYIKLQSLARYPGALFKNLSFVDTAEMAPVRGPQFDKSFYTCFESGPTLECVTCVIYFREIPRPFRGGQIQEYRLTGTKENGELSSCSDAEGFNTSTHGESNTLIVKYLAPNSIYRSELQAFNAEGPSPVTSNTLKTSPPPDLQVWAIRRSEMYKVYLSPPSNSHMETNISYYVHYCNATMLQELDKLNRHHCLTNMVTKKATLGQKEKYFSEMFTIGKPHDPSLVQPIFFVSSELEGEASALIPARCRYGDDKELQMPKLEVKVVHEYLHITIKQTCGADHEFTFGQPTKFCYKYTDSRCCCEDATCQDAGGSDLFCVYEPSFNLVERILSNLQPRTTYCISVRTENAHFSSGWKCANATTGDFPNSEDRLKLPLILTAVILLWIAVLACYFIRRVHSRCQKFKNKLKVQVPKPARYSAKRSRPSPHVLPVSCASHSTNFEPKKGTCLPKGRYALQTLPLHEETNVQEMIRRLDEETCMEKSEHESDTEGSNVLETQERIASGDEDGMEGDGTGRDGQEEQETECDIDSSDLGLAECEAGGSLKDILAASEGCHLPLLDPLGAEKCMALTQTLANHSQAANRDDVQSTSEDATSLKTFVKMDNKNKLSSLASYLDLQENWDTDSSGTVLADAETGYADVGHRRYNIHDTENQNKMLYMETTSLLDCQEIPDTHQTSKSRSQAANQRHAQDTDDRWLKTWSGAFDDNVCMDGDCEMSEMCTLLGEFRQGETQQVREDGENSKLLPPLQSDSPYWKILKDEKDCTTF